MTVTTLSLPQPRRANGASAPAGLRRAIGRVLLVALGLLAGAILGLLVGLITGLIPFVC